MSMTSSKPYLFRAILEWVEDNQMTPDITVDVMYKNVSVPMEYVSNGQIKLNISSRSIQLYCLDNTAIHFSARFNGVAQDVYIPMHAIMSIFARENGQGLFFDVEEDQPEMEPTDIPSTETQPEDPASKKQKPSNKNSAKKGASHLKVIK